MDTDIRDITGCFHIFTSNFVNYKFISTKTELVIVGRTNQHFSGELYFEFERSVLYDAPPLEQTEYIGRLLG